MKTFVYVIGMIFVASVSMIHETKDVHDHEVHHRRGRRVAVHKIH